LKKDKTLVAAIFLASMLGTAVSGAILKWGMLQYGELGVEARMAVSLVATAAYGLVVIGVFYAFFPETKLALQRIFWRK
jgi:hypothetical protein